MKIAGAKNQKTTRKSFTFSQNSALVGSYLWGKIADQLRSAAPVVVYLLVVQVLLLGVPVRDAGYVTLGVLMVVVGLAVFLEGLMLAVMPLGELCGVDLPRRVPVVGILSIVFALGLLGTLAEPSIAVLQRMGATIMPWEAPLLFVLLGKHSFLLVLAIGIGVGIAFAIGMLRSLLGWSLKPVLAISVALCLLATFFARFQPNLALIYSLSWDTGAITTSDVTVPLMLALGVGLSRMGGSEEKEGSGFGSVALASLVPVVTVLILGFALIPSVPNPMTRSEFLGEQNSKYVEQLFQNKAAYEEWAKNYLTDEDNLLSVTTDSSDTSTEKIDENLQSLGERTIGVVFKESAGEAARAIIPLAIMLVAIVWFVLKRKLPWPDEMLLGVFFCLIGMAVFTTGVEIGLLRLGEQTGENLTSLFQGTEHPENTIVIQNFDLSSVKNIASSDGSTQPFFPFADNGELQYVPFNPASFDESSGSYQYVPVSEPRFGGPWGFVVLLLVAFGLGFTTTLVEPAVATLGVTVENVTVGVFPRSRTVWIVSAGVGVGTLAGISMLVWNIPLLWFIGPMYFLILVLTVVSSELFTGIAWDAGGATTASITTPLVLAIGAGLGGKLGIAESFGILTLASGFPIMVFLVAGLFVNHASAQPKGVK